MFEIYLCHVHQPTFEIQPITSYRAYKQRDYWYQISFKSITTFSRFATE